MAALVSSAHPALLSVYRFAAAAVTLLLVAALPVRANVITTVDSAGNVGEFTSLQLNGGNPVVSYFDDTNTSLKLATCTANCATSTPTWVITTVDSTGFVGIYSSLQLNGGNPVVSYYDVTNADLKLATCTANCATATPTWVITAVESAGDVGLFSSLQLNAGNPVVSYYDQANADLKVALVVPPVVTTVAVPANGTYGAGAPLTFTVSFSEPVTVNTAGGTPTLPFTIGATVREAVYVSGSGTTALTFSYSVAAVDADGDGIAVGAALVLNGATIRSANDAILALNGVASTTGVLVLTTYAVAPSAGANGTIAPNTTQAVAHGTTTVFTVASSIGYTAAVGGTCGGTLVANTYTTNVVTADCTVVASFNQNSYTVTSSVTGANGTIAPSGAQAVLHGATGVFAVAPGIGYAAAVGGTCGGALVGATYTTNPITGPCTVVASFTANPITTYTGPSATGTGSITASFTGGGPACTYATSQFIPLTGHAQSPPAGTAPVVFPHGLFDFILGGCTPGATITMTIIYPAMLPAGTQYYKYGPTPSNPTPHWYVLPATFVGNTVSFSITDGGLGDDDLAANGTIVDQGGPGAPGAARQVPTLSPWALLLLGSLLLLAGMRRRLG
jgi:hypothetical protein